MSTSAGVRSSRNDYLRYLLREGWPLAVFAGWLGGAVVLWYVGKHYGWSPGEYVLAGSVWILLLGACCWPVIRGMFGPVFWYEVVRLGRRRLTFVLRLLYVLAVMALLFLLYLDWLTDIGYLGGYATVDRVPSERLNQFATTFFYWFMAVQYGVVTFLTPAYVAGTVADEKERKTLEFLLATDLRNHEIIFGKLAARVTNLLMYVLAGLPVVAFLQLFGGIDPDMLLAGTAATVITVIGLSAVSVYFSTHLKRPRDAIALTYLAVAAYLIGSGVVSGYVRFGLVPMAATSGGLAPTDLGFAVIDWNVALDWLADGTDWLAAGNALYLLMMSLSVGRGTISPVGVSDTLFRYGLFWVLLSALLLGISILRLRAIALRQAYGGVRAPRRRGVLGTRPAKPRPDVGDDPMFWKEVFVEGGVRGGCLGWAVSLGILGLIFFFPLFIAWHYWGDLLPYAVELFGPGLNSGDSTAERWEGFTGAMNAWCRGATAVLGLLAMLAAVVRGAGAVSGERDRDTWVSLISTPLSAWDMVRGKWLGTVLGIRRAYFVILLVWALTLAVGAVEPIMILATALALATYVSAFAWLGILCSITSRTTLIATLRALMSGLFLAGGFWLFVGLCCVLPINILFDGSTREVDDFFEGGGFLMLGLTPPFVLGWMPIGDFYGNELGPFSWDEAGLGPLNPVAGFFFWFALNWTFGILSWQAFRRASNRTRDTLAARLPRRRAERVDRGDNWLPKRKPVSTPRHVTPPPGKGEDPPAGGPSP